MPTHIPLEILGRVFALVLPDFALSDMTHQSLVSLCLVCKDWRDAAYLHHRFWRKISIDYPSSEYLPHDKVLLWHSRSGGLPRSLEYMSTCLVNPHRCDSSRCGSPNPVLASILRYSQRIDHLKIYCRGPQCIRSLQASMDGMSHPSTGDPSQQDVPPPNFEELPIGSLALHWSQAPYRNPSAPPVPLPPISSFQLDIDGCDLEIDFEHGFAAWFNSVGMTSPVPSPRKILSPITLQNLTSLSLNSGWDIADLSEVLSAASSLLNLTLDLRAHQSYSPTTDAMKRDGIVLPKVQALTLRQLSSNSLPILDVLRLRVGILRHLNMSFQCLDRHDTWGTLDTLFEVDLAGTIRSSWTPFINKHADALETLSIQDASLSNDAALKSLVPTELNNIHRFTLDGISPHPSLFSGESGPSFPHLESLSLLNMDDTFAEEEVLEFLKKRRPYRMVEGRPVFEGPPDTIQDVTITYREPSSFQAYTDPNAGWTVEPHSAKVLSMVGALMKGGTSVEIGPIYRLSNGDPSASSESNN